MSKKSKAGRGNFKKSLVQEDQLAIQVINRLGGASKTADTVNKYIKLNNLKLSYLSRVTVQKWKNNGVPAKWNPVIQKITGLKGSQINPSYPD